jgi:hypothetical protein
LISTVRGASRTSIGQDPRPHETSRLAKKAQRAESPPKARAEPSPCLSRVDRALKEAASSILLTSSSGLGDGLGVYSKQRVPIDAPIERLLIENDRPASPVDDTFRDTGALNGQKSYVLSCSLLDIKRWFLHGKALDGAPLLLISKKIVHCT